MRTLLARGDDLLIDQVCQPTADRLFWSLDVDCFRIARFCTDIAALAWIISQAHGLVTALKHEPMGILAFHFALLLIVLGAIMTVRSLFDRNAGAAGTSRVRLLNPLRARMFGHRLICVLGLVNLIVQAIISPAGSASLAVLTTQFFLTAAVFMGACSNPGQGERMGTTALVRGAARA